jgi:valyl-tRNA synthetase
LASVVQSVEIYMTLEGTIDKEKEKEKIEKEIARLERNITGSEKKLENEKFVQNAPDNLVAYEREKLASMKETLEKVKINLAALS